AVHLADLDGALRASRACHDNGRRRCAKRKRSDHDVLRVSLRGDRVEAAGKLVKLAQAAVPPRPEERARHKADYNEASRGARLDGGGGSLMVRDAARTRVRGHGRVCVRAAPHHEAALPSQDRLGGVADRLDVIAGVEEGDDPARAAFESLVAPGEGANERAAIEHQLDVTAEILRMQKSLLKRPHVERKNVGRNLSSRLLMRELERAEELARRLAVA